MIPHEWYFFHSKLTCMSYLRYLSIATCRYHHPDWKIHVCHVKNEFDWGDEGFEYSMKDYSEQLKSVLNCCMEEWKPENPLVAEMPPANQSDIFAAAVLSEKGGWYSDTDSLFTRSHENLANADYAFVGFGGHYYHVGMFGSVPNGWVMKGVYDTAIKGWDKNEYNSTGTYAILKGLVDNAEWLQQFQRCDPTNGLRNYLLPQWAWVPWMPQQHTKLLEASTQIDPNGHAVHMYGSSTAYSKLNRIMTPEYIKAGSGEDLVSRYIRILAARGEKGLFLL